MSLSCAIGTILLVADADYAPDGSPVPLYAALPALGEPELIHHAVPAEAKILELGAGAGRITRELLALGHPVVAVDQSREMLAHIVGAETVLADIESLALGRRFPVVLLASNFVNDPDRSRVRRFLDCCARHVLPEGQVLLQRYPKNWEPSTDWREVGSVRLRLRSFELAGALLHGEMEYVVDGRTLLHAFDALLVSEDELDRDLRAGGLERTRTLDPNGAWIEAAPLRP
jgi:SAM-dependent methyltransferase